MKLNPWVRDVLEEINLIAGYYWNVGKKIPKVELTSDQNEKLLRQTCSLIGKGDWTDKRTKAGRYYKSQKDITIPTIKICDTDFGTVELEVYDR